MYAIYVQGFDGSLDHVEHYDNEEAFGFAVAEYCGLGYEVLGKGRHVMVKPTEGA